MTDAGNIRYQGQKGFTDDCVNALAMACFQPESKRTQTVARFNLLGRNYATDREASTTLDPVGRAVEEGRPTAEALVAVSRPSSGFAVVAPVRVRGGSGWVTGVVGPVVGPPMPHIVVFHTSRRVRRGLVRNCPEVPVLVTPIIAAVRKGVHHLQAVLITETSG